LKNGLFSKIPLKNSLFEVVGNGIESFCLSNPQIIAKNKTVLRKLLIRTLSTTKNQPTQRV